MITPLPCVELTFSVGLGVTGVSAQPLKQRSHHFGAAEALEPGPNVLVVPFQSADLQDPGKRKPRKIIFIASVFDLMNSHLKYLIPIDNVCVIFLSALSTMQTRNFSFRSRMIFYCSLYFFEQCMFFFSLS